jgi:hypothetical protein
MKHGKALFLAGIIALTGISSCDSIDCTLNNTVVMICNLYQDGKAIQLNDTLTVTAGKDNIMLLNSKTRVSTMALSLSYFNQVDTLMLNVKGDGYNITDTIWIEKTSYNHFESPDCPVNMFHTITEVRSTHLFIDSVSITRPDVDFYEDENLQIHFYPSAD